VRVLPRIRDGYLTSVPGIVSMLGGYCSVWRCPPSATTQTRITTVWTTDDEPLRERSVWLDVALGLALAAFLVVLVFVVLP
jgi:hypothetical protein